MFKIPIPAIQKYFLPILSIKIMKRLIIPIFLCAFVGSFAQTAGTLTISTTTSCTDPAYPAGSLLSKSDWSPWNCNAIWIEDNSGVFVKSLSVWAGLRREDLKNWVIKSAMDVTGLTPVTVTDPTKLFLPQPDGTTGATLYDYGTINCSWNGKNTAGVLMPDGIYKIQYELTDNGLKKNGGTEVHSLFTASFTKGSVASTQTPANVTSFEKNTIKWTPGTTAIDEVKYANLYSVYPNPTKASIFVNGPEVQRVEITDLNGKSVLRSNQPKINLSALVNGSYLVNISTAHGAVVKKLIKE